MVAADLAGNVLYARRFILPFSHTESFRKELVCQLKILLDDGGIGPEEVLGVGLSIPGIVSNDGTQVLHSHALGVHNMHVEEFQRVLELPCRMMNDAYAGCLAEAWGDSTMRNAIYLSLSNSVGSAILIDRRLYLGHNLRGGEIGHMTLIPDGRECFCGKRGCVDAYCNACLLSDCANGSLSDFFERLFAGDRLVAGIWNDYLNHVATAVNNLHLMLDCDVVIGGYVGEYIDDALPSLRRRAAARNPFEDSADYIRACIYKNQAAALGAAIPWLEQFFQSL